MSVPSSLLERVRNVEGFLEGMYENGKSVGIRDESVWRRLDCTMYWMLSPSNISWINFTIPLLLDFPNFMLSNFASLYLSINKCTSVELKQKGLRE